MLGWIDPFDRMAYVALTVMVLWYSCVYKDAVGRQDVKHRLQMAVPGCSTDILGRSELNCSVLIHVVVVG